jgi:CCR4-NOT transcription complex subunit 7/8
MDFNTIDLNNLFLCKDLLEVIPLDDLGKQRMEYFNKKIEKFKTENNDNHENQNNNNTSQKDNKNKNQNNNNNIVNINQNDNNDNYQNLKNIDILDMNKVFGFHIDKNKNKDNETSNNEQNNININENKIDNNIKSQSNEKKDVNIENKLDSEKKNINQFPRLIKTELINNPNIKNHDSKDYENVKSEIINNLKLSSTEMDYHNIAMAKDHFEAIVYYLRELLGKNK